MNDTASFSCVSVAWQAHEGELRGYLRHRFADQDVADDMLQEVFIKAMRAGQGFCSLDNPRAWLFQVARNAVVDRFRMERPTEPLPEDLADSVPAPEEAADPIDALADCLTHVLSELAPDDTAILQACDLDGQTQKDFAAAHGLSLPAAKTRLLRARQRLRERLTKVCRVQFSQSGQVAGHLGRSPGRCDDSRCA